MPTRNYIYLDCVQRTMASSSSSSSLPSKPETYENTTRHFMQKSNVKNMPFHQQMQNARFESDEIFVVVEYFSDYDQIKTIEKEEHGRERAADLCSLPIICLTFVCSFFSKQKDDEITNAKGEKREKMAMKLEEFLITEKKKLRTYLSSINIRRKTFNAMKTFYNCC